MNPQFELTAAHVERHIESIKRTLRVVLEDLMEADIASPTSLETLIGALLCQGVTLQEIAFLINESNPSLNTTTQTNPTLDIKEFKLLSRESVN